MNLRTALLTTLFFLAACGEDTSSISQGPGQETPSSSSDSTDVVVVASSPSPSPAASASPSPSPLSCNSKKCHEHKKCKKHCK